MTITQRTKHSLKWARLWALSLALAACWATSRAQMVDSSSNDQAPPPSTEPQDLTSKLQNEPMTIFDPPQKQIVSPIRQAAEQLLRQQQSGIDLKRAAGPKFATYQYEMEGASEAAIMEQASVQALTSAAARIYFDDYYLVGRDLLKNYLLANGRPFIVRKEVLGRRLLAGDRVEMRVKLSVDLSALYQDLMAKRFIAEPNLRPWIAVNLKETIQGEASTSGEGRQRVETTMQQYLFQTRSREMREPPLDSDDSTSAGLLQKARMEAQRHNVDVLITGSLTVRPAAETKILFDDYSFNEGDLVLKMYRVDNGELLQTVEDHYSASGVDQPTALANLLDAMVVRSTKKLAESLRATWGYTMLSDADCRLLVNGLDTDHKSELINDLKRFSPDVKVFEKAYYGNVWVLNVVLPEAQRGKLEDFLRNSNAPQFRVTKVDDRHLELQAL